MCLYVDYEINGRLMDSGHRTARVEHSCTECSRTIEPGERYAFWTHLDGDWFDGFLTTKMCAHCEHTIDLGCEFTGCPRQWYWEFVHDTLPDDAGFVGDIIHNHTLTAEQERVMVATVFGRQAHWRHDDGTLMAVPLDIGVSDPDEDCRMCDGTGWVGYRICSCVQVLDRALEEV